MKETISLKNVVIIFLVVAAALIAVDMAMKIAKRMHRMNGGGGNYQYNVAQQPPATAPTATAPISALINTVVAAPAPPSPLAGGINIPSGQGNGYNS